MGLQPQNAAAGALVLQVLACFSTSYGNVKQEQVLLEAGLPPSSPGLYRNPKYLKGFACVVVGLFLRAACDGMLPLVAVAPFAALTTVLRKLLSQVVLRESVTGPGLAGILLMLAGILIVTAGTSLTDAIYTLDNVLRLLQRPRATIFTAVAAAVLMLTSAYLQWFRKHKSLGAPGLFYLTHAPAMFAAWSHFCRKVAMELVLAATLRHSGADFTQPATFVLLGLGLWLLSLRHKYIAKGEDAFDSLMYNPIHACATLACTVAAGACYLGELDPDRGPGFGPPPVLWVYFSGLACILVGNLLMMRDYSRSLGMDNGGDQGAGAAEGGGGKAPASLSPACTPTEADSKLGAWLVEQSAMKKTKKHTQAPAAVLKQGLSRQSTAAGTFDRRLTDMELLQDADGNDDDDDDDESNPFIL